MIQRIQSLYLLVVCILFVSMIFSPLLFFSGDGYLYELNASHFVQLSDQQVPVGDPLLDTYFILALEIVVAAIALFSIFLFRNRRLQMRLTIFSMVLQFGFYALMGVYLYALLHGDDALSISRCSLTVAFPLVGIILSYLALRAIIRDEVLVSGLGRLR
ncbi:MAG: DUF4293 domain-containing protein [Paludibacteraceae bacterium]|nr:DUF4293 domain-containing protein [Paludibacteraceae bacterium]